jgi:hypothetical protein
MKAVNAQLTYLFLFPSVLVRSVPSQYDFQSGQNGIRSVNVPEIRKVIRCHFQRQMLPIPISSSIRDHFP